MTTYRDKYPALASFYGKSGIDIDKRFSPRDRADAGLTAITMHPVFGPAVSAGLVMDDVRKKDYWGALMDSAGFLPLVPALSATKGMNVDSSSMQKVAAKGRNKPKPTPSNIGMKEPTTYIKPVAASDNDINTIRNSERIIAEQGGDSLDGVKASLDKAIAKQNIHAADTAMPYEVGIGQKFDEAEKLQNDVDYWGALLRLKEGAK